MEIHSVDQQVSVSGQITVDDVPAIVGTGTEVLICNRPDHEVADQPLFAEIQVAAEAAGMQVANIPFSGGQMTQEQVEEFSALMGTGKRIHAYCRTGNRCTQIWGAAKQLLG